MSAKRYLHLLLVASLIVFLFALPSTNAEESELEIVKIEHQYSKSENSIEIKVKNYDEELVNCNLILSIFSEDLREPLPLPNSITFFDIEGNNKHHHNFTFTVPQSGDYTFNTTLLVEKNDIVIEYYSSEKITFYDYKEYQIQDEIADNYFDSSEHANWVYSEENNYLELKNIEGAYDTGVVLGPFNTEGLSQSIINLEYQHLKSNTANFTISVTKEFNSSELYSTDWNLVHSVNDENNINFEIPKGNEIFILIRSEDSAPNASNYWIIGKIYLEKLSLKHSLSISHEEHFFFSINNVPELIIETKNEGAFNQQLGNISIVATLFSEDEEVATYIETPSIEAGENQNIIFRINENLGPGNYYIKIKSTIIDKELFYDEKIVFISISNENLGGFDINLSEQQNKITIESQNNEMQILLQTDQISTLNLNKENTLKELINNYYIVKISSNYENIELTTESDFVGRILSIVSMDQIKYNVKDEETEISTIEGITAPTIIFDDGREKTIRVWISNDGFYTETYTLNYIYASTFVEKIDGDTTIDVMPNQERFVEIVIKPLTDIPRDGGSQFNIEISNNNENKLLTYVLSYLNTNIEITEISCDRNALLLGQNLKCTTILTNKGYSTTDLNFVLSTQNKIIEETKIEKLDYLETWTLTTIYTPELEDDITITGTVKTIQGNVFEKEIDADIRVISPEGNKKESSSNIIIPKISLGKGLAMLSFTGIIYQLKRSENLRYLGLKFFFVPMYSRLQKDTLADEPTRQRLLKYIYAEPGANFKQLKDQLSLHNGTLAHHINILESHDIIKSYRSGRQRLFFPIGANQEISRTDLVTNETQKNIMNIVKNTPGITQSMISKNLAMSRQKINYHVNLLVDKAFLKIEKQGRITRLYPLYYT